MTAASFSRHNPKLFNPPKLKDFVLTEKLGSGTYATVYKAYKKSNDVDEVFAIKCIQKSSLNRTSIENLLVEIEILKQIKHDHVVQLVDFQWDTSYIFLIMEYCGGGDLSTYIHARKKIPEFTVRRFLQQIASALLLLHEHNISHMDLKPQNILLTSTQYPMLKIADFGFAQYLEKNQDFSIRGSPLYMAPEMVLKHHYDAKVDLWSVGVILYESLFGFAPFASASFDQLEAKIKSQRPIEIPLTPEVSKECRHLLTGLLQRDPEKRISFDDFFTDLFVDLEHMPSERCLEKATTILTEAISEDKKGNVASAAKFYAKAIEYFVPAIYYEKDGRKKQAMREKVKEYCARAEKLKHSMKPTLNSRIEVSSLQQLVELSQDKPNILNGLHLVTTARAKEATESYEESLDCYEKGLSELMPTLSEEEDPLRKKLLQNLIQGALKRAERIKDYIQIHKIEEVTSQRIREGESETQSKCLIQ